MVEAIVSFSPSLTAPVFNKTVFSASCHLVARFPLSQYLYQQHYGLQMRRIELSRRRQGLGLVLCPRGEKKSTRLIIAVCCRRETSQKCQRVVRYISVIAPTNAASYPDSKSPKMYTNCTITVAHTQQNLSNYKINKKKK